MGFYYAQVYGLWDGMLIAIVLNFIYGHIANIVVFLIGRYILRDYIYEKCIRNEKFFKFNKAVRRHGFYVVFLSRFILVLPYSITNYVASITDIKLRDFIWANNGG